MESHAKGLHFISCSGCLTLLRNAEIQQVYGRRPLGSVRRLPFVMLQNQDDGECDAGAVRPAQCLPLRQR